MIKHIIAPAFNIAYEFNDSDRTVCLLELRKFLDMNETTPFDVLAFLSGHESDATRTKRSTR